MADPHEVLASLTEGEAAAALFRCCGSTRWVEGMLERAPFATSGAVLDAADEVWARLGREDHLEAFSHHPLIGAEPGRGAHPHLHATAAWAREEQAGAARADPEIREQLQRANVDYAARFGFPFIVCATGKSAREMLDLLHARLLNQPEAERLVAAGEQALITRLRLKKLGA